MRSGLVRRCRGPVRCGGGGPGSVHRACCRGRSGTLESTFITYFSGGVVIGLVMLLARGGNLASATGLPWYVYSAGLLGLVIIGTLSLSVGDLGLVPALVVITVSQFVVGAVINHFGLAGRRGGSARPAKVAGFALLGLGTYLVLR